MLNDCSNTIMNYTAEKRNSLNAVSWFEMIFHLPFKVNISVIRLPTMPEDSPQKGESSTATKTSQQQPDSSGSNSMSDQYSTDSLLCPLGSSGQGSTEGSGAGRGTKFQMSQSILTIKAPVATFPDREAGKPCNLTGPKSYLFSKSLENLSSLTKAPPGEGG